MGFKTISLSDEVFRRLRDAKRPGESFTDTVERLLQRRPSILDFSRLLPQRDADRVKQAVERARAADRDSQPQRMRRLTG